MIVALPSIHQNCIAILHHRFVWDFFGGVLAFPDVFRAVVLKDAPLDIGVSSRQGRLPVPFISESTRPTPLSKVPASYNARF